MNSQSYDSGDVDLEADVITRHSNSINVVKPQVLHFRLNFAALVNAMTLGTDGVKTCII